jgi:multiple sugar transport system permease protein
MEVSAISTYLPTFIRWLLVGVAIFGASWVLNTLLQRAGVRQEAARGLAFILPWLLGFIIWQAFPFVYSFLLSFTEYNTFQPPTFVGLENYRVMFTDDPEFWPALSLTLRYAFYSVPLGVIGALCVALLLNQGVRGLGMWRTIYYLPAILPAAATALLWSWMLSPTGIINQFLAPVYRLLGVPPLEWFTDPDLVLPSYVIMSLWGIFGANAVIMLASLKNVPQDLYEVASIDGAGSIRKFLNITIPMISPALFYAVITGIIGALQIFTQAFFIQTPTSAGQFINVLIYQNAFGFLKYGYASAMAWILFLIILVLTAFVIRSSNAWVYYESGKA